MPDIDEALSRFSRTWLNQGEHGERGEHKTISKRWLFPVAKMKGEQGDHSCSPLEKKKKGEQLRGNI